MTTLYRLASLRGAGARLRDVREAATRGCLQTVTITGACCQPFLMHLVRQHVLTLPGGAVADADTAVARVVSELGITVGKPEREMYCIKTNENG